MAKTSRLIVGDTAQSYYQRVMAYGALATPSEHTPANFYRMLEAYYLNNGLYDVMQTALYNAGIWTPGMKALRNPANRAVEFYAMKLWPGSLPKALPIITANERIIEPIHQVWAWSNWGSEKQLAARWYSMFGDLFIKVATDASLTGAGEDTPKAERVFFQNIKPEYVINFKLDTRGHVTYIRIDTPKTVTEGGRDVTKVHIETWDKAAGLYREYLSTSSGAKLSQLKPTRELSMDAFGIDFVPVVHAKLRDIGEDRGVGCFVHVLDKIDEANRMATRLHQILFRFNKPTLAVGANANDPQGRPLPPPRIGTAGDDEMDIEDNDIIRLPGMATLEMLVPDIKYADALSILDAQMSEIKADLPELKYYEMVDLAAQISGRAVRLMLGDAVDKVIEARGNIETALARADAMALTIGKNAGLFGDIGDYEKGDFAHTFAERDVIPIDTQETAETITAEKSAGFALPFSMRRHGFSEAEIEQNAADLQAERDAQQQGLGNAIMDALRRERGVE